MTQEDLEALIKSSLSRPTVTSTAQINAHFRLKVSDDISADDMRSILAAANDRHLLLWGFAPKESKDQSIAFSKISNILCSTSGTKLGAVLCGECGNGKTQTLNAIKLALGVLRDRHLIDIKAGENGILLLSARDVVRWWENEKDRLRLYSCECLFIDDMGTEKVETSVYGNKFLPMCELLEKRYSNRSVTFVSTNMKPEDIRERYGIRIADRWNETMELIPFTGKSFR